MLQLLLMILKILGIVLLVILGLVLTILLLVLFVPVRYQIDASFDGKPKGGVLVSWLLRLVTVRVNYDGSVKALVKLLFFKLFDKTLWPSEDKDEEAEDGGDITEIPLGDDELFSASDTDAGVQRPSKAEEKPAEAVKPEVKPADPAAEAAKADAKPAETVKTEENSAESVKAETGASAKADAKADEDEAADAKTGDTQSADSESGAGAETASEEEKKSTVDELVEKIQAKLLELVEKAEASCKKADETYTKAQEKITMVRDFLTDKKNQETIRLILRQVLKAVKHILPRKISGQVKFGFSDPAKTGQILTYISPFYGMYAKTFKIEPSFEEEVMEGEVRIKGHIRLAVLLWIVIRIILNKNFRTLIKRLLKMRK